MNNVTLIGRLVRDNEIRTSENGTTILRNAIAVERRFKKNGEQTADFINILAFGKTAEFINTYFAKGNKLAIIGRIQTGSYENKEGAKVYTCEVVIDNVEFVESKSMTEREDTTPPSDGFVNIPAGIDEELPFN